MTLAGALIDLGAFASRELALFAGCGFLLLGAGDLLVDIAWIGLMIRRRITGRGPDNRLSALPPPQQPGRLVIFLPAWDESAVIGAMLDHALATLSHPDWRLYVGCYPNDPATIAAVERFADPRLRLVVNPRAGPTSKADSLNSLWSSLLADEAREGFRTKAVILHDAEDIVHSGELAVFDSLIERHSLVQIPVLPLVDQGSRWISGSYLDEFSESHGKELVVRAAIGAGLPSAGVGCAIARDALAELADADGRPFDADSLTEDYEIGLKLAARGHRACFARVRGPNGGLICTREHFPNRWKDAVAQKSRWIAGIALSGWDRLGWSGSLAERLMRLRDRQSVVAALLLSVGYGVFLAGPLLWATAMAVGHPVLLVTPALGLIAIASTLMLAWRLVVRFAFTTGHYGWREGMLSLPRCAVGNTIAIGAARQAIRRYLHARRTGELIWGKTRHVFPAEIPAE